MIVILVLIVNVVNVVLILWDIFVSNLFVNKFWMVLVINILGISGMILVIVMIFWLVVMFNLVNVVVMDMIIVVVINFEKNLICI